MHEYIATSAPDIEEATLFIVPFIFSGGSPFHLGSIHSFNIIENRHGVL